MITNILKTAVLTMIALTASVTSFASESNTEYNAACLDGVLKVNSALKEAHDNKELLNVKIDTSKYLVNGECLLSVNFMVDSEEEVKKEYSAFNTYMSKKVHYVPIDNPVITKI